MWDSVVVKYSEAPRTTFKEMRESRPDQEQVRALLLQFIDNCRFENCLPQEEYIRSLGLKNEE